MFLECTPSSPYHFSSAKSGCSRTGSLCCGPVGFLTSTRLKSSAGAATEHVAGFVQLTTAGSRPAATISSNAWRGSVPNVAPRTGSSVPSAVIFTMTSGGGTLSPRRRRTQLGRQVLIKHLRREPGPHPAPSSLSKGATIRYSPPPRSVPNLDRAGFTRLFGRRSGVGPRAVAVVRCGRSR